MKENRILSNGYEEKSFSKKTRKLFREKRVTLENSTFPPLFYGVFFLLVFFLLVCSLLLLLLLFLLLFNASLFKSPPSR